MTEEERRAEEEAAAAEANIPEQQSPLDQFQQSNRTPPQEGQTPGQPVPPPPPPDAPEAAPMPQPYQGQAFPGLPVLIDRGQGPGGADQYTYNGAIQPTEQAAMQARAADAANPQSQAAYAQAQAQRPQPQPGDATSPEMTSIQLRAELDRHTLSRADQLELTQLQNGIARVQADAREGRVPTAQAIQIQRQLQERLRPKMITMEAANGIKRSLEIAKLNEDVMHQTMRRTQQQAYWNANPAGSSTPITDPQGRVIGQTRHGLDGHDRDIMYPREPAAPHAPTPHPVITGQSILGRQHGAGTSGSSGASGTPALPGAAQETPATPAQMEATGAHAVVANNIAAQHQGEFDRLQPNGPPVFDPLPQGVSIENAPWTLVGQQKINDAAKAADASGQTDRSRLIRQVGGALRTQNSFGNPVTTGQLTPAQQQILHGLGYYHGQFTPELDRALGRLEAPPAEQIGTLESGSGVSVRQGSPVVAPAILDAARGVRNLLGRYGTEASIPPASRADFQNHLATLRLFNWGRTQEEQNASHGGPRESPVRPTPARRPPAGSDIFGMEGLGA